MTVHNTVAAVDSGEMNYARLKICWDTVINQLDDISAHGAEAMGDTRWEAALAGGGAAARGAGAGGGQQPAAAPLHARGPRRPAGHL